MKIFDFKRFFIAAFVVMALFAGCEKDKPEEEETDQPEIIEFTEPEMVFVEGGTFMMGSPSGVGQAEERPTHQVRLSSYYIGKYQITQVQWEYIMGANPSNFKGNDLPVEMVSWIDIVGTSGDYMEINEIKYFENGFIYKLNKETGKEYRLPTESEWEYAARGGEQSNGFTYSGSNINDNVAWYSNNSNSSTHPIGTKGANELGIYDMNGNVLEWCSDWYGAYNFSPKRDPRGPEEGTERVLRGGSWLSEATGCRVVNRYSKTPDNKDREFGFRVVLHLEQEWDGVTVLKPEDIPDYDKIYKPREFANMNMLRSDAAWSFVRSKQSEHFIVFWQTGFGLDPNSSEVQSNLRVDIDDLLAKSEIYYDMNVNKLKFAIPGKSNTDKYKMQIYLHHTTEWMAYGGGYDDVIGALWINPATCQPVGSVIAHEIGHSFQYQIYADLLAAGECQNDFSRGFRYGFGGNGGNGYWEQTAQWQAWQSYPNLIFSGNFTEYARNHFRHVHHEWQRYANAFINYYWAEKQGIDFIGRLWREAVRPEDPMQAYMRINNMSVDQFNADMYEASTRFVTWDIDAIRDYGNDHIGRHSYQFMTLPDGAYQVTYSHCPGSTGYSVIPLNVPDAGTVITTSFTGLLPGSNLAPGDPGRARVGDNPRTVTRYNNTSLSREGWRYGYVALLSNGQRIYSEMNSEKEKDVIFTIPNGCERLWFVVTGAPTSYRAHAWDEDETNDEQFPYKVKFTNTNLLGTIDFTGDEVHEDVTITYDVKFPFSAIAYSGATVTLSSSDLTKLGKAFILQPTEIKALIGNTTSSKIRFYAVEATTGALNGTFTANGYGHWYNATGNVCRWDAPNAEAKVFSEFDENNFSFLVGQFPGRCFDPNYTIKQALVYTYETGKSVRATFVFNITVQ